MNTIRTARFLKVETVKNRLLVRLSLETCTRWEPKKYN